MSTEHYLFNVTFTDLENHQKSVVRPKLSRGAALEYVEAAYGHFTQTALNTYEFCEEGVPTARVQIESLGGFETE